MQFSEHIVSPVHSHVKPWKKCIHMWNPEKSSFDEIKTFSDSQSSTNVLFSSFWHLSSPWQGQISVHGKLLVPHTQVLAQMSRPLQEQTRSHSTSALTGPANKTGIMVSFSTFHPWPTGEWILMQTDGLVSIFWFAKMLRGDVQN